MRFAIWLLKVFIPSDQREPVIGDLLEEFASRPSDSRWLWRQVLKTVAPVVAANLLIVVVAAPLLFFSRVPSYVAAKYVLANYHPYHYVDARTFLLLYDFLIGSILIPMSIGWLAAVLARGRELKVSVAIALVALLPFVTTLAWYVANAGRPIKGWQYFLLPPLLASAASLAGGSLRHLRAKADQRHVAESAL